MQGVNLRLLLVSFLGSLISIVCLACAQESQGPMLSQVEEAVSTQVGSVDIRGRVVSQDGRLLEDVTIKYFFREFGDVLINKKIDYKRKRVDGEFRLKQRGISSVKISFLKEGYYPETWSFSFDPTSPRKNPGGTERFDIEIILEKESVPAPLTKFEGILRADIRGPVSVVGVKRQGSGETWLWKDGAKRQLDLPYVLLIADNRKSSELPTTEFKADNERQFKKGLERGWIRFSDLDDGDGFIVFDPGEVKGRPVTGMRRMTEAPESGYEASLDVAAAESPQKIYFYCKLNGKHGKGMVTGRPIIAIEEGRQVARAAIIVYMNPTGSRNVSYVHD